MVDFSVYIIIFGSLNFSCTIHIFIYNIDDFDMVSSI